MKRQHEVRTWELLVLAVLLVATGWFSHRGFDASSRVLTGKHLVDQAYVAFMQGQVSRSQALLEQSLALDPYDYQAYRDLASTDFKLTHDRLVCMAVYERALQFIPKDGRVHEDLGRLHYLNGDYDLAVKYLENAQHLLGANAGEGPLLDRARRHEPVIKAY